MGLPLAAGATTGRGLKSPDPSGQKSLELSPGSLHAQYTPAGQPSQGLTVACPQGTGEEAGGCCAYRHLHRLGRKVCLSILMPLSLWPGSGVGVGSGGSGCFTPHPSSLPNEASGCQHCHWPHLSDLAAPTLWDMLMWESSVVEGGVRGGLVPSDPSGLWSRWSLHSCHPPGGREGCRDLRVGTCRLHGIEMTVGHRNDP